MAENRAARVVLLCRSDVSSAGLGIRRVERRCTKAGDPSSRELACESRAPSFPVKADSHMSVPSVSVGDLVFVGLNKILS